MGLRKTVAHSTIRSHLEEVGFPEGLELKQGKHLPDGIEFIASGKIRDKTAKVVRVCYSPKDHGVIVLDDYREKLGLTVVDTNVDAGKKQREAALPEVMHFLQEKLGDDFLGVAEKLSEGHPLPTFACIAVRDRQGMRHLVDCVATLNRDERDQILAILEGARAYHTSVITWTRSESPENIAGKIISDVRRWQRSRWPKAK